MDNLKHFGIGLKKDKYSHDNVLDTLKNTFAPTPQVAQQRRDAVINTVKTVVAPRSSDMIGSSAMVAGRTMATALPAATPARAAGASALGLASTERLGVVSGTTQGLARSLGSLPMQTKEAMPITGRVVQPNTIGRNGSISNDSTLRSYPSKSVPSSPSRSMPGMITPGFNAGQYTTLRMANLQNALRPTAGGFSGRPPTLQSPGRIGQAIQVPASDKFLTNTSGNAMQNIGALSAASRLPSSGSWIYK